MKRRIECPGQYAYAEDLRRVQKIVGRAPRAYDYDRHGTYGRHLAYEWFGNWYKALEFAGIKPDPEQYLHGRYPAQRVQDIVLAVARLTVKARGVMSFTMREVAQEAGLPFAAIKYYFLFITPWLENGPRIAWAHKRKGRTIRLGYNSTIIQHEGKPWLAEKVECWPS
jgi:hypothetical protein